MSGRRRGTYITGLRDYLGEDGFIVPGMPAPAENLAFHLAAIVSWVTRCPDEPFDLTNVRCRRSPDRRRCPGLVLTGFVEDGRAIGWKCPICGDHGYIHDWEGTFYDLSDQEPLH